MQLPIYRHDHYATSTTKPTHPYEKPGDYCAGSDNVRHLLEEVIRNEAVIYREDQEDLSPTDIPRNPIWGFYACSRVLLRLL